MGFTGVEFRCPKCGSSAWGTSSNAGFCKRTPCTFRWSRAHDFRVFVRERDGRPFESARELEVFLGLTRGGIGRAWTLSETLHELLTEIMTCPPTIGVVELWTFDEKRRALEWASREVLALEGEDVTRVERPIFVESGAATA